MTSISDLNNLHDTWSQKWKDKQFPKFCPLSKGPYHTLIFLETPGPRSKDGEVSMSNDDDTAREIGRLVKEIAFDKDKWPGVLLWNAIPWVLDDDPTVGNVKEAIELGLHDDLLKLLGSDLKFVVLMGDLSRRLLPHLTPRIGNAHLYGGHHTSRRTQNRYPETVQENEAVFQHIRKSSKSCNFQFLNRLKSYVVLIRKMLFL